MGKLAATFRVRYHVSAIGRHEAIAPTLAAMTILVGVNGLGLHIAVMMTVRTTVVVFRITIDTAVAKGSHVSSEGNVILAIGNRDARD
jgi:hypothetical protein